MTCCTGKLMIARAADSQKVNGSHVQFKSHANKLIIPGSFVPINWALWKKSPTYSLFGERETLSRIHKSQTHPKRGGSLKFRVETPAKDQRGHKKSKLFQTC